MGGRERGIFLDQLEEPALLLSTKLEGGD